MSRDGKTFCDYCHLVIAPAERNVKFRRVGTDGKTEESYKHFHNRVRPDCWSKALDEHKVG